MSDESCHMHCTTKYTCTSGAAIYNMWNWTDTRNGTAHVHVVQRGWAREKPMESGCFRILEIHRHMGSKCWCSNMCPKCAHVERALERRIQREITFRWYSSQRRFSHICSSMCLRSFVYERYLMAIWSMINCSKGVQFLWCATRISDLVAVITRSLLGQSGACRCSCVTRYGCHSTKMVNGR